MRGREITLWLDERWYDALSKQLKGETLEEHLENILDEMYNQLPQREYERISHELWAEQQAEEEAREAARRFAVFHVTENGSSDYILAEEKLELLSTARRLRSYIRKPPDEAPHRFVETLLHTQRLSQEEFNSYVSERLDNTGRVVGAYDIDLDSGDMEAVSIMDGWKRFRIRDVSTAAYFAMKKGNASSDERWRIFLDRLEERALNQEPEPEYLTGSRRLCAEDISFAEDIIQNDNLLEFYMEVSFNADEVFGTDVCTSENDDWLNIYANYDLEARRVCDTLELYLQRATATRRRSSIASAPRSRLCSSEDGFLLSGALGSDAGGVLRGLSGGAEPGVPRDADVSIFCCRCQFASMLFVGYGDSFPKADVTLLCRTPKRKI